jgi:uncharacterized membrane protein YsdA (DUF1294 family)
MNFPEDKLLLAGWLGIMSLVAFLLFGYDKWQAGRRGGRVAESTLCLVSALGGWPGGLLGIAIFRHKSAKGSFQLKFAAAFAVWIALLWATWRFGEKLPGGRRSSLVWSRSDLAAMIETTAAEVPRLQRNRGRAGDEPCG